MKSYETAYGVYLDPVNDTLADCAISETAQGLQLILANQKAYAAGDKLGGEARDETAADLVKRLRGSFSPDPPGRRTGETLDWPERAAECRRTLDAFLA